jgi:hypothetical protein
MLGRALLAAAGLTSRHGQAAAGAAGLAWQQAAGLTSKPTALIKELRERSGAPISDVKVRHRRSIGRPSCPAAPGAAVRT